MSFPVSGKVAFVTGANRGIGEAIVDALIAGTAKVYAAARTESDLTSLVQRHGGKVVPLGLDVTNSAQIQAAVTAAADTNLLVNNAGVASHVGGDFEDPQWITAGRAEMDVNYFGTFAVTQAFAPVLRRNGGGAVVNLATVASFVGFPLLLSYSASKAATHSLTQSTRILLKPQGTQVYGVYPGAIDTRMAENLPMAKTSAADTARGIIAGLEAGVEDILPDPMSVGMGAAFFADPKGLERQVAGMAG